jgi:hypothetical protein
MLILTMLVPGSVGAAVLLERSSRFRREHLVAVIGATALGWMLSAAVGATFGTCGLLPACDL